MSDLSLLNQIEASGISLAVTDRGTIRAVGDDLALDTWSPVILNHKPALIDLLTSWADLESAIHECCDARRETNENRRALLNDCRNEAATDWPWFAWYFRQETAKWTH